MCWLAKYQSEREREREIHSAAFINKVCLGSEVAPSFSSQAMP